MIPQRIVRLCITLLTIAALFTSIVAQSPATKRAVSPDLPRSAPEAQGISSADLLAFINAADEQIDAMNSFLLIRHGHIVAEGYWAPYDAQTRHALYSLTKSFTSTAVGLAVAEGKLRVDDLVLKYFPEEAPATPSANLKAMRISDLLSMSTGHHAEAPNRPGDHWVKNFLAQPVEHKPGTFFLYNTPASHMLSAIVQRATGMKTIDYLRPRLFEPLGIEDPVWNTSPQGETSGGWGLKLRTREIARFGQLYLRKGEWRGKRILPAEWVEIATSRRASNGSNPASDWDQGYGFQFWRSRNNAYRGDGAFGQYCLIIPEHDTVVIITSGVRNMQAVLDLIWQKLLPTLKEKPLPANAAGRKQLEEKLAGLSVRTQKGEASSPNGANISGRKFTFTENAQKIESISLELGTGGETTLVMKQNGAEQRVAIGHGSWKKSRLAIGDFQSQPVAGSGAWTAPDTYTARLCLYEEPFILTINLKFVDDKLQFDSEYNVNFGPARLPQLVGTLQR